MRDPSGQSLVLAHGPYRAEVVTVGGCLRTLTRDGLDLVAGWPTGEMCANFRGGVMMPWANRIADGRYTFAGVEQQVALSEPGKHNALHGLAHWVPWTVADQGADRVELTYALPPQPGYPAPLDLSVGYHLGDDGLTVVLTATNVGAEAAPYSTGVHPYLTVGRRVDDCLLTLPATSWCAMSDRGLPGAPQSVVGTPYDFRSPRALGDLVLDHPFGGVRDEATAVLADPASGREVRLTVHEGIRWLHLFTGDAIPGRGRESLAVEPTTAPPDAFNSGIGLVVLEPGQTHRAAFTIAGD